MPNSDALFTPTHKSKLSRMLSINEENEAVRSSDLLSSQAANDDTHFWQTFSPTHRK